MYNRTNFFSISYLHVVIQSLCYYVRCQHEKFPVEVCHILLHISLMLFLIVLLNVEVPILKFSCQYNHLLMHLYVELDHL